MINLWANMDLRSLAKAGRGEAIIYPPDKSGGNS
jgi:hypothetical protein